MIVDVLGADEAFFDVGFRDALHRVAELGGHQLGGVVVDDVVDLQHHALTHQELDDLDAAGGHAVGELAHRDHIGDDDLAGDARLLLAAALALFTLAFAGAANRSQRAHPLGALAVAGDGLDRQTAFAALRGALGARDGLGRRGRAAAGVVILVRTAVEVGRAGARGLAGGALHLGRRGRSGWADPRAARA